MGDRNVEIPGKKPEIIQYLLINKRKGDWQIREELDEVEKK